MTATATSRAEARDRLKHTSSLCIRKLHEQCTAPDACECDCHRADPPPANGAAPITWEDPPGRGGGRPKIEPLTPEQERELVANPGRWARVRTFATPTSAGAFATKGRKGKTRLNPDEWEFAGRKVDGNRSALYIRRRA